MTVHFTTYLEAAIKDIRKKVLAQEVAYADDRLIKQRWYKHCRKNPGFLEHTNEERKN